MPGHREEHRQPVQDARSLPTRERCKEVLALPNRDVPHWTCPVCGDMASRAHWIAEHVLHHLNHPKGDT